AFAAGYIGNYNLLAADIASRLLQRPIEAQVAIRPEAIALNDPAGVQNDSITAVIKSHSLLSNVIRYRVEARRVELLVDVLNRSAADLLPQGHQIGLTIDASAIHEVA
ncbi:MAG TPA: spermidine/putrescine ABC transporter ATP-binding protein, partial [Pseudomonas sp.]|nr:spermidine/putrescine ABC transporter ATP-binding protein [Pseudomonas sp.]